MAAATPAATATGRGSLRCSWKLLATTAAMAVVAPCSVAVPSPRTSHNIVGESGMACRKTKFSTTAKPVPTAKPSTAASIRKPIRRRASSTTISAAFRISSVTGAAYRVSVRRSMPTSLSSHSCSGWFISATAAPHASAMARLDGRSSLKLSISSRPQSSSSTGRSARQMFSMPV